MLEHEDLSWKVARLVKCQTRINNNNGEKQQLEKENEVAQVTNDGELMERTDLFDKQFLQNVADIVGKVWNMGSRIFKTKKEALKERTRVWKSSEHWEETKKGHEDKSDEKVTLKVRTVWHPGEHLRTREPKHEHVDKSNKEETKEERTKVGKPDIGWDEDANEFLKQHSRRAPATAAPAAAVRAAPVAAASALPQPSVGPSGDRVAYVRRVATITVAEGGRKERQKETEKKKPTRPETGVSSRTSITAANEGREENQGKTETAKSNVSEAKTTETRKTETAASTMTTIKTTEGGKKGRQKQEKLKEVHRISEALKQSKEEFEAELEVKVKAIEEVNLTRAKRAELDNVIKDLKYEVEETEKQSDAVDAACDKLEQEKKVLVQKLLEQKQYSNKMYELNLRLQEGQELSLGMAGSQAGLSDQEIKELDAGNQNLLGKVLDMDGNLSKRLDKQEHMDNTLMNRIKKLHSNNSDSVSSIRLRLSDLDKDGKDNITQIVNPQKTINNQNERVNTVNANRQKATEKDKFRPAEDRLANINSHIQGLNKTMVVSEQKHTETAEKIQEVTILISNIQVQVKSQKQKMVEQSANDMNKIETQLKDVDAVHQTLVQKFSGMENGEAEKLCEATADLEKKIHDAEHKLDQSGKAEIQSVYQHLERQMQTNNSNKEEEHTIKNNKRTMKMHATEQKSMNSKREKREDRLNVFPQPEPREVQVANNNEKEVIRKSHASEMHGPIAKEEEKEDKSELNENEKKGKAEEKYMDKLAAKEDSEENNNSDEKRQRREKEKEKGKEPQEFDDNQTNTEYSKNQNIKEPEAFDLPENMDLDDKEAEDNFEEAVANEPEKMPDLEDEVDDEEEGEDDEGKDEKGKTDIENLAEGEKEGEEKMDDNGPKDTEEDMDQDDQNENDTKEKESRHEEAQFAMDIDEETDDQEAPEQKSNLDQNKNNKGDEGMNNESKQTTEDKKSFGVKRNEEKKEEEPKKQEAGSGTESQEERSLAENISNNEIERLKVIEDITGEEGKQSASVFIHVMDEKEEDKNALDNVKDREEVKEQVLPKDWDVKKPEEKEKKIVQKKKEEREKDKKKSSKGEEKEMEKMRKELEQFAPKIHEIEATKDKRNTVEDRVFKDFCRKVGVPNIRQSEERELKTQQKRDKRLEFENQINRFTNQLKYEQQREDQLREKVTKFERRGQDVENQLEASKKAKSITMGEINKDKTKVAGQLTETTETTEATETTGTTKN